LDRKPPEKSRFKETLAGLRRDARFRRNPAPTTARIMLAD
jgi:hypothetical protein